MGTTDTALAANVGAAFLAAVLWARKPTWVRGMGMGVFTAFAFLSKFTALGYLPICLGFALICYVAIERPGIRNLWKLVTRYLISFAGAAMVAAFVIWACYFFSFGNHFSHRLNLTIPVPAPALISGVKSQLYHNTAGHGAFLLGHFSWQGWWYYLLVALAVKTPIAIIVLTVIGLYVLLSQRFRPLYLLPVAFAAGILLPASFGHIDIAIRYVEPIWMSVAILSALGVRWLLQRSKPLAGAATAGVLVTWLVVAVALQHPDYRNYFNSFAGSKPEQIIVDSNSDWGHDMKLLAIRLHKLGAQHLFLVTTLDAGNRDPKGVIERHIQLFQSWYGLPQTDEGNACIPAAGWNVVSTTVEKSLSNRPTSRFYRGPGNPAQWYEKIAPDDRLGPLLLFNIPANSKLRSDNCDPQAQWELR